MFEKTLFKLTKKMMSSEKMQEELQTKARSKAMEDGYMVTFGGSYQQGLPGNLYEDTMNVPFVIAQTAEQISKLKEGTLEGRVYEMNLISEISGQIDQNNINFHKNYITDKMIKDNGPRHYSGENPDPREIIGFSGVWEYTAIRKKREELQEGSFDIVAIHNEAIEVLRGEN